ncbi:hypothetical protein BC832DRAFT_242124 [Gaertneriomyces semiglobifer]|nr:hypothetical protein BC832DRAFT_242124 [Gaertneriomyces semiglobifer]
MSGFPELPLPFGDFNQDDPVVQFWTFVVYTWVIAIVSLFYFFYLSRALGQIVSRLVCIWTWRKYRAWVELESIQISPISGKILFRNFRYHSRNQSVQILRGHIGFRYWFRHVRQENADNTDAPCRFKIRVDGLEWFIYNRTPAYEKLQEVLSEFIGGDTAKDGQASPTIDRTVNVGIASEPASSADKDATFRKILPLQFECFTGTITLGNPDLPSIVIFTFKDATGTYETAKARSVFDYYRTNLDVSCRKAKLLVRDNVDYREPMLNQAARARVHSTRMPWTRKIVSFLTGGCLWGEMTEEEEIPLTQHHWGGLRRYNVADTPLLKRRRFEEYAKVTTVVEAKRVVIKYYYDVPGPAPLDVSTGGANVDGLDIGNGDLSPEWGLDLTFQNSKLHYGPWTDRQRGHVQSFFFPSPYRTVQPTPRLSPGALRLNTQLRVLVAFEGETLWRVPFREPSKDWKYADEEVDQDSENGVVGKGRLKARSRPYAWMDLKFTKGVIHINVPMLITETGYSITLWGMFERLQIVTSLNHSTFLKSDAFKLDLTMPSPRKWNDPRTWTIQSHFSAPKIFLLRDHVTLISDLVKDWTSGPPTTFEYFVPCEYKFKFMLDGWELWMSVNQGNVFETQEAEDTATSPESLNTYLVISGTPRFTSEVRLPFLEFDQSVTQLDISCSARKANVRMSFPPSHTLGTFLSPDTMRVGTIQSLAVNGEYRFHHSVQAGNVDSLLLNINAETVNATVWGFFVEHLVYLKENYMGEYNSFVSVDEWRKRETPEGRIRWEQGQRRMEAAREDYNPFEVNLLLFARDVTLRLPGGLYKEVEGVQLFIGEIQVENRSADHVHDVEVMFFPVSVYAGAKTGVGPSTPTTGMQSHEAVDGERLVVNHLSIHGHRLSGPAPKAQTYAVDWRLNISDVSGTITPDFGVILFKSVDSFFFHFDDTDNILLKVPPLPDVTTLEVLIASWDVKVRLQGGIANLVLPYGLRVQRDNLIMPLWCTRTLIDCPSFELRGLVPDIVTEEWSQVCSVQTTISVCMYTQTPDWEELKREQIEFVRWNDETTRRAVFVYAADGDGEIAGGTRKTRGSEMSGHSPSGTESGGTHSRDKEGGWTPFLPPFRPPFVLGPVQVSYPTSLSRRQERTYSDDSGDSESDSSFEDSDFEDMSPRRLEKQYASHYYGVVKGREIPYRAYLKCFDAVDEGDGVVFVSSEPDGAGIPTAKRSSTPYMLPPFPKMRPFGGPRQAHRHRASGRADESKTAITVDLGSVSILVTPLILHLLQEYLVEMDDEMVPEELLDALHKSYMSDLLQRLNQRYRYDTMDVCAQIEQLRLHCVQDMLLPDAATFLNDEYEYRGMKRREVELLLCEFDLIVGGLGVKMMLTRDHVENRVLKGKLALDADQIATKIRFLGDATSAGISGIPSGKLCSRGVAGALGDGFEGAPVVLDLLASGIVWRGSFDAPLSAHGHKPRTTTSKFNIHISTRSLSVVSMNETIEIMFGAVFKWVTLLGDISRLLTKRDRQRTQATRRLFSGVAEMVKSLGIDGDAPFLTDPSPLWALGHREHQTDNGWKLLMYLRFKMMIFPQSVKEEFKRDLKRPLGAGKSIKLFEELVRCLESWRAWDVKDITETALLRDLFNVQSSNPAKRVNAVRAIPCGEITVDVTQLDVTVYEVQNDDSSVSIGPTHIALDSAVAEKGANPDMSSSTESGFGIPNIVVTDTASKTQGMTDDVYLDIKACMRIEKMDAIVSPNLLGFIRHFIRVHHWFQARLEGAKNFSQSNAIVPDHPLGPHILADLPIHVFGTAVVEEVSLTATAHNLIARAIFERIQTSTLHYVREGVAPGDRSVDSAEASGLVHNSVFSVADIQVHMLERTLRSQAEGYVSKTLIAVDLGDIGIVMSMSKLPDGVSDALSIASVIRYVGIQLPRSLLKLHTFLEKWGDEDLPRYDFLLNKLMKEFDPGLGSTETTTAKTVASEVPTRPRFAHIDLEFMVSHFAVQSDLLASLSFYYDAHNLLVGVTQEEVLAVSRGVVRPTLEVRTAWEADLAGHEIKFVTRTVGEQDGSPPRWSTFQMPRSTVKGHLLHVPGIAPRAEMANGMRRSQSFPKGVQAVSRLEATMFLDTITTTLDVSVVDQLITTQSVLGGELNDILEVFSFYARKRVRHKNDSGKEADREQNMLYALNITVQGLRIAAESPASVIIFEADPMTGYVRNFPLVPYKTPDISTSGSSLLWKFTAPAFSFSLVRNVAGWQDRMRGHHISMNTLAYVLMGLAAQNHGNDGDDVKQAIPPEVFLLLQMRKLHAIVQPHAMTSIADTAVYYKKELTRRSRLKADELLKAKQATERLFKSINVPLPSERPSGYLFEDKTIIAEIRQIGIAMPLLESDGNLDELVGRMPRENSPKSSVTSAAALERTIPALLISAKSIQLNSNQLKTAAGEIFDLSWQFVPGFDAAQDRSFAPAGHPSVNRIALQHISAALARTNDGSKNKVRATSAIKGFEFEVDAGITDYLNRLGDIFEREKASAPIWAQTSDSTSSEHILTTDHAKGTASVNGSAEQLPATSNLVFLQFDAQFEFETGVWKIWSQKAPRQVGSPATSVSQLSSSGNSQRGDSRSQEDPRLHVFATPGLTLIAMGKTVLGESNAPEELNRGMKALHIELIIHASQNVIHPDILIFFRDLNANLKTGRLMKHQESAENSMDSASSLEDVSTEGGASLATIAYQRHRITFYLRLSETKISLSCQPVSKVSSNYNLNEADFFFSFVPKTASRDKRQYISCTGNILGTSGALRHQFSPEDCLNAEIPRLTFNFTIVQRKADREYTIELGVPSLMASLNARHLQDLFLFQRVWLEQAPPASTPVNGIADMGNSFSSLFNGKGSHRSSILSLVENVKGMTDKIHVALRINNISVAIDLGQAIGKSELSLDNAVATAGATRDAIGLHYKKVDANFETLGLKSDGKFSGMTTMSKIFVHYHAHNPSVVTPRERESEMRMELTAQVQSVSSQLQYQYERVLILHVEPVCAAIVDRWDGLSDSAEADGDGIFVDLRISKFKGISSRRTVPTMLHLVGKLRTLYEEKKNMDQQSALAAFTTLTSTIGSAIGSDTSSQRSPRIRTSPLTSLPDIGPENSKDKATDGPGHRKFLSVAKETRNRTASITVTIGETFVVLTRHSFRDADFAIVKSNLMTLKYRQEISVEDSKTLNGSESPSPRPRLGSDSGRTKYVHELTNIKYDGFSVKKGTAKPISQTEESIWNPSQWFAVMTSAVAKNVVGVPPVEVFFETETGITTNSKTPKVIPRPVVEYTFRTTFAGPIDVALNFGLYRYVQDLVGLYQKTIASESDQQSNVIASAIPTSTASSTTSVSPATSVSPSASQPQKLPLTNDSKDKDKDMKSSKPTLSSGSSSAAPESDIITFLPKHPTIFEPQLKVTGDATSWEWVEWLGVHKGTVPRLVYDQITVRMGEAMCVVEEVVRIAGIRDEDGT